MPPQSLVGSKIIDSLPSHDSRLLASQPCLTRLLAMCRFSWDAPLPGKGSDTFVLSPDGQMLTHFSELHLTMGGSCVYKYAQFCGYCIHYVDALDQ